jgi:hypothetical protein
LSGGIDHLIERGPATFFLAIDIREGALQSNAAEGYQVDSK